ncbi:hypothetical protein SDC9_187698 [bioreactor metagenome]|uniref:Uncharacterized protein n=1 Tax=bioreactor metagenome TaxID=1076179 RepID=A0A645HNX9_9ZZZZ
MPSVSFSYISAPATPAAGPDKIVKMGRLRTSSTVITPPSHRMTISGLLMPAFWMLRSVIVAASSILGMMLALTTAVRVRILSPYSFEISLVAVPGTPSSLHTCTVAVSFAGSSTLNASAATMLVAPPASRLCTAVLMSAVKSFDAPVST